jgi:catechol 2,3-dioxygenase-like lactoylglutathione lyase family enzyme
MRKTFVLAALLVLTFQGSSQAKGIRRHDRLRQPGFVFVELFTQNLPGYVAFFQTVAGFKLIRNEGTFVQLQSEHSEILLNSTKDHPFLKGILGHRRVLAAEIGIVVTDLDKAYAAARKFTGWKIVAGVVRQPWGPRDFRVLSPDGYYLRLTEPSA